MVVHVLSTYLTTYVAFSLTLSTIAFVYSTLRWFEVSTCMATSAGHPPSSIQHVLYSCSGFISLLTHFVAHWNPHVHVLLAEGCAVGSIWHEKGYFKYESLRKSFQTILLKKMYASLGCSFKPVIGKMYKSFKNGFYINAPKTNGKIRDLIKYIGRYLGRPVIANSRIDDYDGESVTFHYKRHEDNRLITEKIPAAEFIKRLVIHIPPHYFNMVRFYGLYAQSSKKSERIGKVIKQKRTRLRFRELLLKTLGIDPHKCAKCGSMLTFCWLTHTPNNEIHLSGSSPPKGVFAPMYA